MRIQVNVSDEMVENIDKYAKKFGMTRSAFCNTLICQGVIQYDTSADIIEKLSNNIYDKLSKEIKK